MQGLITSSNDGWKQKITSDSDTNTRNLEEKGSSIPSEIDKKVEVVVEAGPEALTRVQEAEARRDAVVNQLAKLKSSAGSGLHAHLKLSVLSCPQNSAISISVPGNTSFADKVK